MPTIKKLKEAILLMIKDDMTKEQIDSFNNLANQCDTIAKDIEKSEADYKALKLDYADIVRNGGGTKKYQEQDKPNPQPKSFEDIMAEVIAQRKDK